MNKTDLILAVANECGFCGETCKKVIDALEELPLSESKRKSPETLAFIYEKMGVSPEDSSTILNCMDKVVKSEIKNKLKHPFGS